MEICSVCCIIKFNLCAIQGTCGMFINLTVNLILASPSITISTTLFKIVQSVSSLEITLERRLIVWLQINFFEHKTTVFSSIWFLSTINTKAINVRNKSVFNEV